MKQSDFDDYREYYKELYPQGVMQIRNGLLGILIDGRFRQTKYIGLEWYEAYGGVYKNDKLTKIKL